jgi:hypothetical protein
MKVVYAYPAFCYNVVLRTCLVSPEQQRNESHFGSLEGISNFSLTVFPEQATIFQPSKRALKEDDQI